MTFDKELMNVVYEALSAMTLHDRSILMYALLSEISNDKKYAAMNLDNTHWACPRCRFTHTIKSKVVDHQTSIHRTKPETAQWLCVKVAEPKEKAE